MSSLITLFIYLHIHYLFTTYSLHLPTPLPLLTHLTSPLPCLLLLLYFISFFIPLRFAIPRSASHISLFTHPIHYFSSHYTLCLALQLHQLHAYSLPVLHFYCSPNHHTPHTLPSRYPICFPHVTHSKLAPLFQLQLHSPNPILFPSCPPFTDTHSNTHSFLLLVRRYAIP